MNHASLLEGRRTTFLECEYAKITRFAARVLVTGAVSMSWQAPAAAQAGTASLRDACRADYQRFCANVAFGGGRVRQCMMGNFEKLAPPCQTALKSRTESK